MTIATPSPYRVRRMGPGELAAARELFATMAAVFEEEAVPLGDGYLGRLLAQSNFWAVAAIAGEAIVGGLTAHALPMTRDEMQELFIYDVAVAADHQRRGVGRLLLTHLRQAAADAGLKTSFVLADNEDGHALDFYRALGGVEAAVTSFTFGE